MLQAVVISAFAKYRPGDHITNAEEVAAVLRSYRAFVVPVNGPEAPKAAPEPKAPLTQEAPTVKDSQ